MFNKDKVIQKVGIRLQNSHAEKILYFEQANRVPAFPLMKKIPTEAIESLSKGTKRVFDRLIRMRVFLDHITVSHAYIAQKEKMSRRQVLRIMHKLRELGLINWHTPQKSWYLQLSNEYMINPLVDDLSFRARCGRFLGGLRLISASLLLSTTALVNSVQIDQNKNVTSLLPKDLYLKTVPYTVNGVSIVNGANRPSWINGCRVRYKKVKQGYTKEERRMNAQESMEVAKDLKSIKLSWRGRFESSAFPKQAIQYADAVMGAMKTPIKDRYAFFKALCLKHCKQHGIQPDFSQVDAWKVQYPDIQQMPFEEGKASGTGFKKPTRDMESQPSYEGTQPRSVSTSGDSSYAKATADRPNKGSTVRVVAAPIVEVDIDNNKAQAVATMQASGEPISLKKQQFLDILAGKTRQEDPRQKLNGHVVSTSGIATVGELLEKLLPPKVPTSPFVELINEYRDKLPTEPIDETVREACYAVVDHEQSSLIAPNSIEDGLYQEIMDMVVT